MTAFLLQILCFTQKKKIGPVRQVSILQKNTKFQDLGKQRERSPCSLKIEISSNYPANLKSHQLSGFQPKTLFEHKNSCNASEIQSLHSQHTQNCTPNAYQAKTKIVQAFRTKSILQIINDNQKQNSN